MLMLTKQLHGIHNMRRCLPYLEDEEMKTQYWLLRSLGLALKHAYLLTSGRGYSVSLLTFFISPCLLIFNVCLVLVVEDGSS